MAEFQNPCERGTHTPSAWSSRLTAGTNDGNRKHWSIGVDRMMNVSIPGIIRMLAISSCLLAVRNILESSFKADLPTVSRQSLSSNGFLKAKSTQDIRSPSENVGSNNSTIGNPAHFHDERPILVLHIGPHKTGTSTIQCDLTYFQHLLHDEASFTYIGRQYGECMNPKARSEARKFSIDTRRLIKCLDHHNEQPCGSKKEWTHLTKTIATLASLRQNVIISDEAFSRMKINERNLEFLHRSLNPFFQVRVVIVYRHYYLWLLSQYNEHYKPLRNRKFYQKWPGEGGSLIHTFTHYFERRLEEQRHIDNYEVAADRGNYQLASAVRNIHPAVYLAQRWKAYAEDVVIMDMHEDGDLTTNFVRAALSPEASNMYSRRKGHAPDRQNPSLNLDSDMVVVRARETGLLRKSKRLSRRGVASYVEQVLDNASPDNLPLVCVNQTELNPLLDRSISFQTHTFPKVSNSTLQRHEAGFREAMGRRKFCNLDVDSVLSTSFAKSLFEALNKMG